MSFLSRCVSVISNQRTLSSIVARTTSHTRAHSSTTNSHGALAGNRIRVAAAQRSHFVFGANTDVGKTVVTAGLVRASLERKDVVHYIKPLQCGGSDQAFVEKHVSARDHPSNSASRLRAQTLFNWDTPASPHLASRREGLPVSDRQVMETLQTTMAGITQNATESTTTWIETAGGVLSPSAASPDNRSPKHASNANGSVDGSGGELPWGWIPQADLYQSLLGVAPVVLVGDGRLGGIAATLSALESLILRGYDVAALVLLETEGGYDNVSALREYAQRQFKLRSGSGEALFQSPNQSIVALPPIPTDMNEPLHEWYDSPPVAETFARLDDYLQNSWEGQVSDLQGLRSAGRDVLWWPFTQHGNVATDDKVTLIDSAAGDEFSVLADSASGGLERIPMFDACASWWTQGVGHGESSMALAAAAAAGRYGHVIFPDVVHAPAVALSQKLVGPTGPGHGWADRVFFSDDGSTAMEVAVKMGIKTYQKRMGEEENEEIDWVVLAQEDCYHGDTLGVMDVAEPSIFNEGQHPWYEPRGLFLQTPTLGFKQGVLSIDFPDDDDTYEFDSIKKAMDVDARILTNLYAHYAEMIEMQWLVYEHSEVNKKIASVVIEPIFLGAGGMKFIDPLWQRALMDVAKAHNVPIIFDEVAAGLHRVGVKSCREILKMGKLCTLYAVCRGKLEYAEPT
jgi:dethiobiotin synthetase/adenosylmethionine--8-amino-7-oxononanoate aminotransferase